VGAFFASVPYHFFPYFLVAYASVLFEINNSVPRVAVAASDGHVVAGKTEDAIQNGQELPAVAKAELHCPDLRLRSFRERYEMSMSGVDTKREGSA
jgi:hypothetical protein